MTKPSPAFDLPLLLDMLSFCRPARSAMTIAFCDRFIAPLAGAYVDPFGNWHVTIGQSPILWSAHCDTVHKIAGRQTVHYDRHEDRIVLSKRSRVTSSCLGADDSAGVFLLVSMIRANVPGHYVFHFAEEIGGIGSSDLAEHDPASLSESTIAIALDRRGTGHVITHQYFRCCSDTFALSLALALNVHGLDYAPNDTGTFTDTANYTAIVRECTNLSVGYAHAHSADESLDVWHLRMLLPALCAIGLDPSVLVVERDATEEEEEDDYSYTWYEIPPRAPLSLVRLPGQANALGSDGQPILDCECYTCGLWYDETTSSAVSETDVYCSAECENYDLHVRVTEQHHDIPYDPIYLDETYEAVQDALSALRYKAH